MRKHHTSALLQYNAVQFGKLSIESCEELICLLLHPILQRGNIRSLNVCSATRQNPAMSKMIPGAEQNQCLFTDYSHVPPIFLQMAILSKVLAAVLSPWHLVPTTHKGQVFSLGKMLSFSCVLGGGNMEHPVTIPLLRVTNRVLIQAKKKPLPDKARC